MMKRMFFVITLLLVCLLTVSGIQAQGGVGWVRFAHASVDAEEISVDVNGETRVEEMEYGDYYLYSAYEEGDYDIEFDIGNSDFEDNIDFTLEVEEGNTYTVLVIGTVDDGTLTSTYLPESEYFTDDDLSEETSQVMILNALDADGFDVVDSDDDNAVWSEVRDIPYVVWNYMTGTWNLNITEPGDEEDIILEDITEDIDFPLGDGFRYLFVIAGTRSDPEVLIFIDGYRTINDLISSDSDLSILSDAVNAIDFDSALETQGSYTVFAPTDDAFEDAFDDVDELLDDDDAVIDLLSYHLLLYYASMNNLADEGSVESALEGEDLEFDLDDDGWLVVNDVTVVREILAVNGIIYVIEEVLEP
jgi:hypothetical protein